MLLSNRKQLKSTEFENICMVMSYYYYYYYYFFFSLMCKNRHSLTKSLLVDTSSVTQHTIIPLILSCVPSPPLSLGVLVCHNGN